MLTNPTWLFAIAALAIPLVIHLWNIRPGKTLKVGSIALIEAASRKSSRSFNLLDVLLFILRCLFLIVLAILLAQPFWNKTAGADKLKGWVLIPRQNVHQVYSTFKPKIDSFTRAGYQLHYFSPGFAAIDTAKLKTLADSTKGNPINNWALLKQLNIAAPENLPLYVFAPNTLNSINGSKPNLGINLHIQPFAPADSIKKWISKAVVSNIDGVLKVTEGSSSPQGTIFTSSAVQQTDQQSSQYQINTNNGLLSVAFKNDSISQIVDTATLRIAIYSDKTSDADYLKAALSAVRQFTNRKISIQSITSGSIAKGKPDWIFWLIDRHISLMAAEGVKNIFVYEPGKPDNMQSNISISGVEPIALTKHINAAAYPQEQILWRDGFGKAVLSIDDNHIYHFYSRFDPLWNDLVWNNNFPKVMLNLLFPGQKNIDAIHDKRSVADDQLSPILPNQKVSATAIGNTEKIDLSKAFWIALVSLFMIERLLAHRTKSIENYG